MGNGKSSVVLPFPISHQADFFSGRLRFPAVRPLERKRNGIGQGEMTAGSQRGLDDFLVRRCTNVGHRTVVRLEFCAAQCQPQFLASAVGSAHEASGRLGMGPRQGAIAPSPA